MKTFVIEKDGTNHIVEIEKPQITDEQALVKMIACGMCGTDVKLLHRTFKGFPESIYPIMLGHEGIGEVVAVGAKVKGYHIGDKVLLPFVDPIGNVGSGWGALSEYGVDSVMLVTFREVLSNIRYFGIRPEHSIVVFGCGPVGSTFIKFLSLLGVKNVIAVDIVEEKLQAVHQNGATYIINSKEQDVEQEVRKLFPDGVDFVLDAIGAPFVVNQAMSLIADRGAVLCYGVPEKEEITIDFHRAPYNWRVIYQQMPRKKEEGEATEQVLAWIRSGELKIKDFISDYYQFDQSVQAYEDLLNKKIMKKCIITFDE